MGAPRKLFAAGLGTILWAQGVVHGQVVPPRMATGPVGPALRPVLSPYLNITGFGTPAVNFYNGTNAEFDRRAFEAQQVNQPLVNLSPPAPELDDLVPRLPQTGHAVGFQYYSPYFGQSGQQRSYFPLNPNATGTGSAPAPAAQQPAAGARGARRP